MIKQIATTILVLIWCTHLAAQSLTGNVWDETKIPVAYATIAILRSSDSAIYKGTLTDEKGNYFFDKLKSDTYFLKISSIGFEPVLSSGIKIDSTSQITMPVIVLAKRNDLNEVSVSAIRNTVEFDNGNIRINVENSPLAKGNTVYDLLSKLPGVSIDNNSISLNGKSGVLIMIDERVQHLSEIQLMNMLRSMNAEIVEKIELLKHPPAKYDASGSSGIIHIKTKKTTVTGFSGSVYTSYSQGFYGRGMGGISCYYKRKNLAFFTTVDADHSYYGGTQRFNRLFTSDTAVTELDNILNGKDLEKNLTVKIGTEWQINKKNRVGCKLEGGPGAYIVYASGTNTIRRNNYLGYDHLTSLSYGPDKWSNMNYHINAQHSFDSSGTTLSFTTDFMQLREHITNFIENYFLDALNKEVMPSIIYKTQNVGSSDIFTSRLDFTEKKNNTLITEAGVKITWIRTSNDYMFNLKNHLTNDYQRDTTLSNIYSYDEHTLAGYYSYHKTAGAYTIQLGLRGEFTTQTGKNVEKGFTLSKQYPNLFPTIALEHTLSGYHRLQLNMHRRIDRPEFDDLNPFRIYFDQYYYFQGNPFLLPHYSYTTELIYNFRSIFSNSISYSHIDRVMTGYTSQNDTAKLITESKKNMKFQNYFAYSIFLQNDLRKWWHFSVNGLLHFIEYKGEINEHDFHTKGIFYNVFTNNMFILSKNTKLEVNAFYKNGLNTGLGQLKALWMASFAIKHTFLKGQLDVGMGMDDIFRSLIAKSSVNFSNQQWTYENVRDSRRLTLTLNYNFGKLKLTQRALQGNEEEKARLRH